ncbi:uncharacterized protein LOC143850233 [Tasmannia lanceolata]|uniref:uncharacterized protein LOC143850233 n=1 Tax=Tasmannia lanceolata TaxID=3420 RepID=UPI004063CC03
MRVNILLPPWQKAAESVEKCRRDSNYLKGPLTSYAIKIISSASEKGRRMNVLALDSLLFEVKSKFHQDKVDLGERTCTCGAYQTLGIPCSHAMAAIGSRNADAFDMYKEVIDTTLDRLQWQQRAARFLPIDPPKFEREPGRAKKLRK